jgi:Flp pilus assembly protein TadG
MTMSGNIQGFLSRLRKDASGNALAIGAAAVVPLIGIVGGALDVGRMYAAKTRLQHACDAAVLGGRQSMTGKVWKADNAAIAKRFFDMNYPEGKYGTHFPTPVAGAPRGITLTPNVDGSVAAVAQAIVPMTLTRVFGAGEKPVTVDCKAQINMPDTDVMMVLDTTGSMKTVNPGDSADRMTALRSSVKGFYNVLKDANAAGADIRYGFVPYSTNVNVGALLKPEWLADKGEYQSRVPDGTEVIDVAAKTAMTTSYSGWTKISGSWITTEGNVSGGSCTAPANNYTQSPSTLISETVTGQKTVRVYEYSLNGSRYSVSGSDGACKMQTETFNNYVERYTETTEPVSTGAGQETKYWWKYRQVEYDLGGLTVGGTFNAAVGDNHSARAISWNGCIEERETKYIDNYANIPKDALDLDIDLVPNGDKKTKWGRALPGLVFARNSLSNWETNIVRSDANFTNLADYDGGRYAVCPSPARKLSAMSETELATYLDGLAPSGNTYHDIGMIWGARLLSPTGIFKDENNNGSARHLIFMTDGETNTNAIDYDAYGWTALDRRRQQSKNDAPVKSEHDLMVEARFTAMCEATRNKNITVWVIAFGTSLTPMLEGCASSGKAYQANNSAELTEAFSDIATNIAHLRLVK